jgi:hypothetical protein
LAHYDAESFPSCCCCCRRRRLDFTFGSSMHCLSWHLASACNSDRCRVHTIFPVSSMANWTSSVTRLLAKQTRDWDMLTMPASDKLTIFSWHQPVRAWQFQLLLRVSD